MILHKTVRALEPSLQNLPRIKMSHISQSEVTLVQIYSMRKSFLLVWTMVNSPSWCLCILRKTSRYSLSLKIVNSPVLCVDLIKYFFKVEFGIFLRFLLKSCSRNFSIVSKLIARLVYDLISSLIFWRADKFLVDIKHEMAASAKRKTGWTKKWKNVSKL